MAASRHLTVDTFASFAEWCALAERGDFALAVAGERVAFGASDGSSWQHDGTDRSVLAEALRIAVKSGRRWWAHGATDAAKEVHAITGQRLRGLFCTQVLTYTVMPETIGKGVPLASQGLAGQAVECALLVGARRAASPPEHRALAVTECQIEDLWRWAAARGYRVDQDRLAKTKANLARVRASGIDRHGIDLTRDVDDTRRWLLTRGIRITDADGRATLAHEHYPLAVVPESSRADWDDFVDLRARARGSGKLTEMSTFMAEGRVIPTIHGIGAITGRMSIGRPALQNMPAGLRGLLLADDGHVLVGCDLDRVEPRIVAAITQDPALIEAVKQDVYTELAVAVFGEAVRGDGAKREIAKTSFLALLYGQGVRSLAAGLGIPEAEARKVSQGLLTAYPVMARWMLEVKERASKGLPLETVYGRPLPPTPEAPYRAINWIVQGSAADLFKKCTLRVVETLGRDALWLPVHDELTIQVPHGDADSARVALGAAMTTSLMGVLITGTPKIIGTRWGSV